MKNQAFSLIEALIVIAVFSILAVVTTQTVAVSLVTSKKSESTIKVRENLEYAVSIIERRVRSAQELYDASCTSTRVEYLDSEDVAHWIQCTNLGLDGRIETDQGDLTSEEIAVTACTFTCYPATPTVPARLLLSITATPKEAVTTTQYPVSISTTVSLRVY